MGQCAVGFFNVDGSDGSICGDRESEAANAILSKVADVKGRFAQELAALLEDETIDFTTPDYLKEAIAWVADEVPAE